MLVAYSLIPPLPSVISSNSFVFSCGTWCAVFLHSAWTTSGLNLCRFLCVLSQSQESMYLSLVLCLKILLSWRHQSDKALTIFLFLPPHRSLGMGLMELFHWQMQMRTSKYVSIYTLSSCGSLCSFPSTERKSPMWVDWVPDIWI